MALSWIWRRLISKLKDVLWLIGPPTLAPKYRLEKAGLLLANGLRESHMASVSLKNTLPRYLSVPGLVRISMRPIPKLSYSAENGFWLMRISRMDSLGGNWPPVKPSM